MKRLNICAFKVKKKVKSCSISYYKPGSSKILVFLSSSALITKLKSTSLDFSNFWLILQFLNAVLWKNIEIVNIHNINSSSLNKQV